MLITCSLTSCNGVWHAVSLSPSVINSISRFPSVHLGSDLNEGLCIWRENPVTNWSDAKALNENEETI